LCLSFGIPASLAAQATASGRAGVPVAVESATQSLLDKAHALEARGRMDMAAQTWQQVLLADPNNTEALGGLARAAKLSGNAPLANSYLDRLRAINPNDPNIGRVQNMLTQQNQNAELQQAGKLAEAGQYAQAMIIYRQVFGPQPPAGDWALAYYETESATDEGRPHAIEGLRTLMERYPADSRYQIALGRILTYNPRTREEGRKLLERHPSDPHAVEALRQSLLWDAASPASASDIRAYLSKHNDTQLSDALRKQPRNRAGGPALTPAERALNAQVEAAYHALNTNHIQEAEQRFKEILADNPDSARALAGMGYVRMQESNFGGAISFLEQAQHDGASDPGLVAALSSARFFYTMSQGAIALNENDLPTAEKQYQAALVMRPASPEALEGLAGTLMKAQQPDIAIQVWDRYVKVKANSPIAWRGLFMAQYGAGNAALALQTERTIPAAVHQQLMSDPEFLRTLASAYSAVGRDADAQRVLRTALDLPFPTGAHGLKAETQLQYAGLLQQANRLDQAAGLFRQVLAIEPGNTDAWEGLVRIEHTMKQDPAALQTLESMPPGSYDQAMRDPGFESTVAAIYQAQNKPDIAQSILEKAVAQLTTNGQRPPLGVQLQLAGIYLSQNNSRLAYPLYRQILSENPANMDAWKGLLSALHSTGRDREALAEVQQIPAAVRRQLENDVDYLQAVGNIYSGLGQPREAMLFLNRVQQHYALQHANPPADIDIQNAYLLFNGSNDTGLYRQLMILGTRADLTDDQRRSVQTIWSLWAVRRANQAAAAGNDKRALAILNAAARSFPDNPGVLRALASGYARSGQPKQAVAIFKSQDMTSASAGDYESAVGAALAANDMKTAETWLRFGLNAYPKDAPMLVMGAKFEEARGDSGRAAAYYRASLAAMPPPDPGAELANELNRPAQAGGALPGGRGQGPQDLAALLGPGGGSDTAAAAQAAAETEPAAPARPYLPSYENAYGTAPVQLGQFPGNAPNSQSAQVPMQNAVPAYMANPNAQPPANRPSTLKDYVPQSAIEEPQGGYAIPREQPLPPQSYAQTAPSAGGSYPDNQAAYQRQQIQQLTRQAQIQGLPPEYSQQSGSVEMAGDQQPFGAGPLSYQPAQTGTQTGSSYPQNSLPQQAGQPGQGKPDVVYGPYVPYVPTAPSPVPVQLGDPAAQGKPPQQAEVTDVLPTAKYVPNAKNRRKTGTSSHPDIAEAQAQSARRRQSNPVMTGQSRPPAEDASAPTEQAQYNPAQAQTQVQTQVQPDNQIPQPLPPAAAPAPVPTQNLSQPYPPNSAQSTPQPGEYGQQYPQPGVRPPTASPTAKQRKPSPQPATNSTIAEQPGMLYPGVAQPLAQESYPAVGAAAPQGTPPTDADLVARSLPPLRNYNPTAAAAPGPPLSQRDQTQLALDALEASYSGWIGGTGFARYRSGSPGLHRLTDLEATFEASEVAGKTARFTIVAQPVFLESGTIDTATLQASTGIIPVLGTLPANAAATPAPQSASGVGGELQMTTTNFGAAVGYTPYNFLISNITARLRWRPKGSHFTLFGDRDSIKETELAYAGLRDPGSVTPFFAGNIWGGVMSTGGGARFDSGNEKAGFYLSVDGASLTGVHVLTNKKYEGVTGAYFQIKVIPGVGSLNVGGMLFGMHYTSNELGLSYGTGGYFSPQSFFLAAVPISLTGHYKTDLHYVIAGSIGVQSFQSGSAPYFPLDRAIETSSGNLTYAATTNTGPSYSVNAEGSYRIYDNWYVGGFLNGNNTNNYNTVTGGFFVRYLFQPQNPSEDAPPTGIFPLEGFRPLRVP
jgi:tetratricopeptide (TPR) repeat protein